MYGCVFVATFPVFFHTYGTFSGFSTPTDVHTTYSIFNAVCSSCLTLCCFFFPACSPSEELSFGSGETEKKSLIILSNVTKNQVAFKVNATPLTGTWTMCLCTCVKLASAYRTNASLIQPDNSAEMIGFDWAADRKLLFILLADWICSGF